MGEGAMSERMIAVLRVARGRFLRPRLVAVEDLPARRCGG